MPSRQDCRDIESCDCGESEENCCWAKGVAVIKFKRRVLIKYIFEVIFDVVVSVLSVVTDIVSIGVSIQVSIIPRILIIFNLDLAVILFPLPRKGVGLSQS